MGVNGRFWNGKRVFVTGHTGFKGAWLSLWLTQLGAKVTGYSLNPPTQPNFFDLCKIKKEIHSLTGDVRDARKLSSAIKSAKPQIIFHMAAQSLVRLSYDDPSGTYATNVLGTVNLLDAVRKNAGVRAVVNVTSDKCYENVGKRVGYQESDGLGGYDPYSNSKGCAEMVTSAYRQSFFSKSNTAVASVRAGNVIGGGDWASDRLVPDLVRAMISGRQVIIRQPNAVRPWQFVLEPLSGYLMVAERLWTGQEFSEGWNFGPSESDARPVRWIVEKVYSRWPEKLRVKIKPNNKLHEAHYLKLNSSKAQKRLGWKPILRVSDAIDWTLAWYESYLNDRDVRSVSEAQISAFAQLRS